jgi:putative ABC transport system permease protein
VDVFVSAIPTEFGDTWGWTQRASLDVPLDLHVLLFTIAACVGLGILVALTPVREASKTDLLSTLSGASAQTPAYVRSHLRHWVVVPQICFSLLLLLLAGVSVRAILKTALVDPGYRPEQAAFVAFELSPPIRAYRSSEERDAYFARRDKLNQRLIEIGEHSPAVTSFALTDSLPISPLRTFVMTREAFSKGGPHYWVSHSNVTPGYFGALGISLARGRFFEARDRLDAPKVAIVDERLAMWLWQGQEPVGQYLALHRPDDTRPPEWLEVVGVVKEVHPPLSDGAPNPFVYLPLEQQIHPYALMAVARGRGYDAELIRELRTAVHEADMDAEVLQSRTLADAISGMRGPRRMAATILGVSGFVGLFLASIGLYGVVSYSVAQRVRELGIRAALGADRTDIMVLVMKEGARVAALGSVFGLMLAFAAIRVTSNQLVAIPAMDVATLAIVPLILASVILIACYVPARRAARVDPMIVLRGL